MENAEGGGRWTKGAGGGSLILAWEVLRWKEVSGAEVDLYRFPLYWMRGLSMLLKPYTRVRLLTDDSSAEGARKGDVGFIVEVYPDGHYEVEFSDAEGITYAQFVASLADLEPLDQQQ